MAMSFCLFVCLLSTAPAATQGVTDVSSPVINYPVEFMLATGTYSWRSKALHTCIVYGYLSSNAVYSS